MEELDEFDRIEAEWEAKHPNWRTAPPDDEESIDGMPFYPLAPTQQFPLSQTPATPPAGEPLLTRRVGPLPVWGWAVLTVVGGGVGYYLYSQKDEKKVRKNSGSDEESGMGDDASESSGGFKTSRSEFARRLHAHLQKNGVADKVKIYDQAEDAVAAKIKHVSPLVTMKCGVKPPIKNLEKFAKRDGLSVIEHEGNVVGFYPGGGKKGKAWESYIDALRDDGQTV